MSGAHAAPADRPGDTMAEPSETQTSPQPQPPPSHPAPVSAVLSAPKVQVVHATLPSPGGSRFGSGDAGDGGSGSGNASGGQGGGESGIVNGNGNASGNGSPLSSPVEHDHHHHHHHHNHHHGGGSTVLSRLTALFHHDAARDPAHAAESSPTGASPVSRPVAFPGADADDYLDLGDDDDVPPTPPPKERKRPAPPDRKAIKVLVVTWNMGDALPKGDLSVLLGDVPAYQPTVARDAVEGLPLLPIENVHPYHVVVFAAQECPTPSGVPRGLGGGLMKGVGLQKPEALFRREKEGKEGGGGKENHKEKDKEREKDGGGTTAKDKDASKEDKDKERDKDKDKEREGPRDEKDKLSKKSPGDDEKPAAKEITSTTDAPVTPAGTTPRKPVLTLDRLGLEGLGLGTPTRNASLQTPTEEKPSPFDDDRHHTGPVLRPPAGMAPGPKGWSAMLEEWLCAGPSTGTRPTPSNTLPALQSPQMSTPSGASATTTPTAPVPLTVLTTPTTASSAATNFGEGNDGPSQITASPIDMDSESPWSPHPQTPPPPPPPTPSKSVGQPTPAKPIGIPGSASGSSSIPIPGSSSGGLGTSTLAAPSAVHHKSPLSMSFEPSSVATTTYGSSISTTTSVGVPGAHGGSHVSSFLVPPHERPPERELNRSPSQRSDRSERLLSERLLDVSNERMPERPRREPGTGPYVNVAKERLLGLYLSVFVYRGCEHLVRGVDKDYVTAGLAGGRFGNKGGILNLNGHRMLFVNAHLAAHTERNDARLANIAKIKSELSLNCFLPPDDPRAMLEDITDRFDTTFWCGDLNFRVDISLLHARWLLEQKKYQDALMFDQLRKAMEDPATNPFPGFQEAPITFMPTFKYDVWKSVRATNREIRRSLRKRRNTLERDRPSTETPHSHGTLEFVPEGDGPEESGSDRDKGKSSGYSGAEDEREKENEKRTDTTDKGMSDSDHQPPLTPSIQVPDHPIPDAASGRSSMYADMSQSFAQSFSTDTDHRFSGEFSFRRSSFSRSPHPTPSTGLSGFSGFSGGSSPLPKRGLKERTKKLLGILALGRRTPGRSSATPRDGSTRRLSVSSYRSAVISEDGRSHVSNFSSEAPTSPVTDEHQRAEDEKEQSNLAGVSERLGLGNGNGNGNATLHPGILANGDGSGNGHANAGPANGRRSSNASQISQMSHKLLASPPRRHLSLIRRSASGRSPGPPVEEEYSFDLDGFDDTKDHRVGRYDTSKKQRVPSWCDRVLYKTHIIPDEEVIDDDESSRLESTGRFGRLSHALSNLGDHFRRRSTIFEPVSVERDRERDRDRLDRESSAPLSVPSTPPGRLEPTVSAGATLPSGSGIIQHGPHGAERLRDSPESAMTEIKDNRDVADESLPRAMINRSITFEGPPITPRTPRYGGAGDSSPEKESRSSPRKQRRNTSSSVESTPSRRASQTRRASVSSRRGSISTSTSAGAPVRRRLTDSGIGNPLAQLTTVKSTGHSVDLRPRRRLSGDLKDSEGSVRARRLSDAAPPQLNVIARFLRDLPGRFHSRVSLFHGSDAEVEEKRGHLAGEVEVLHYGTIDDAGMRQLEGRSDHRPAIFAAAIYV